MERIKRYTFAVEPSGKEVAADASTEKEAHAKAFASLPEGAQNGAEAMECIAVEDTPAAPDHALLLSALASGRAFMNGSPKEACRSIHVSGTNYGFECDDLGCPMLHGSLRKALVAATASR